MDLVKECGRMIFVTVGSQKFQFNRLLQAVDKLVGEKVIAEKVFAQIGYSDYRPKNYEYKEFLDRKEFAQMQSLADIVITHGGTGAIIGAVKKGKKVIAVPRMAKYGEHVDDHQFQLIEQFKEMQLIEVCYQMDDLGKVLSTIKEKKYLTYHSNTDKYLAAIDKYIQSL